MKIILPKPFLLAIIVLLATRAAIPQPGCTDPLAINYDPSATENDGSCLYPPTTYQPAEIATLALTECSGLIYFDDHLWTLLDSGNPDNIYELDTLTGAVIQTQAIPNADNKDWEDFAQDAEHIYIGDFGNNGGDRTDLRIYKIKKTDLLAGNPDPQLIEFVFSDQTDFTPAHNANNYDCEAFFFRDDSLHLFSKNWLDFKTRHYVLPAQPGSHTAQLRDSLFVQGQITGADISENGTVLLLGYNTSTSETFLWLLFDFDGNRFFSGNKRRISLGSALTTSQVEGIAFSDTHRGYICSERFSVLPPKLLMFDIAPYISGPVAATEPPRTPMFSISPNPVSGVLSVSINDFSAISGHIKITDISGKKIKEYIFEKKQGPLQINTSCLPPGAYFIFYKNKYGREGKLFLKK